MGVTGGVIPIGDVDRERAAESVSGIAAVTGGALIGVLIDEPDDDDDEVSAAEVCSPRELMTGRGE